MLHYDFWDSSAVTGRLEKRLANHIKQKEKRQDVLLL